MRRLSAATLFTALFVLLGAVVAQADQGVGFTLSEQGAAAGDVVHFSIFGAEDRATYTLEIDGEDVAEGTVPADAAVTGAFTMPDLGQKSMEVTVEAQIEQPDETTTRESDLQYVLRSQASSAPGGAQASPAPVAPVGASGAAPGSRQHQLSDSRPASRKRHTRHPEQHARKGHVRQAPASVRRHLGRAGSHGGHGSLVAASPHRAGGARSISAHPGGGDKQRPANSTRGPPHHANQGIGVNLTFLTSPPAPALFSLASGVSGSGSDEAPVAAAMVLLLLGLTAMTVAGGGLAPRRPPVRRKPRAPASRPRRIHHPYSANGRSAPVHTPPGNELASAVLLEKAAASFAPIALALVNRRATLATRSERKYVLDMRTFERFVGELGSHYLILEIGDERVFRYDTVYFDTPALTTYRDHLQDRRRRFKCRTRLYAANGPCFFEVKLKGGRGETIKRRLALGVEDHGSLTTPSLVFLERALLLAYGSSFPAALAPVLRTSYRRLTLVGRTGAERLTFDFELTFAADGEEYSIQPGNVLLETKADLGVREAGGEATRVLRRLGVREVGSCSKYCLGVALSHPELPDNRFRPLIRRYFDPSRHPRGTAYDRRLVMPPAFQRGEIRQPAAPVLPTWQEGPA
jgi:VTC domain-containing protein